MSRPTTQTEQAGRAEPAWLERLAAQGEVRLTWLYSKKVRDRAAWLACGLGAWGILTGYSLFLLVWHEQQHPWKFILALVLAAIASFIVESARGLIKGHRPEAINGPRLIITILTLAIVELFVVAVHAVATPSAADFTEVRSVVFGDVIATQVPAILTLVALAVVWTLVGSGLAAALMFGVPEASGSPRVRAAKSAGLGALVGALGAPAALLAAVVLIRIGAVIYVLCTDPGAWLGHIRSIRESNQVVSWLMRPLDLFVTIWNWSAWGPALMILAVIVVLAIVFEKRGRPGSGRGDWSVVRVWLVVVAAVIIAPVVFAGFWALLKLLALSALVWVFPAGAIGGLAPALRHPSEDSRTWSGVALAAALILAILTFTRLTSWWFLLPAGLLLLTWQLLREGTRLGEYWPLVALTAAFVVAGATWAGHVTFAGVFEAFQDVNNAQIVLKPESRPAGAGRLIDYPFGFGRFSRLAQPGIGLGPEWEISSFKFGSQSARLVLGQDGAAETKSARPSDEELDRLASSPLLTLSDPDASDIAPIHAQWKALESSTDPVESRVSGKRSLHAQVAWRARGLSQALLTGGRRRAYFQALRARLQQDLEEVDAAQLAEQEWRACSARVRHHAFAEGVAVWDRALALQQRAQGREAKDVVDRLILAARPELVVLEKAEVERGSEALAAVSRLEDRERLPALRALVKAATDAHWRTPEGSNLATEQLLRLKGELSRREAATIAAVEAALVETGGIADAEHRAERALELEKDAIAAAKDWSTPEGRAQVDALAKRAGDLAADARKQQRASSRRLLETCLCASLGFWVTVGMLAGFSLLRSRGRVVKGADGQKRCFWAESKAVLPYHDSEHGAPPATDRDLFRRLSLELLGDGGKWDERTSFEERFGGFDPGTVAAMEIPGDDGSGARESCDRRASKPGVKPLACPIEGTSLVIENARRLLAWYEKQGCESNKDALISDLRSRAHDPEELVAHVGALFCLRRTTPVATFLQSVGILPGAHFPGCRMASDEGRQ